MKTHEKILMLIALVFIVSTSVFAAAPLMGPMSVTPIYTTDHNYSKWTNPYTMTISSYVLGSSIDINSCQYTINNGFSWVNIPNNFNSDTNIVTAQIQNSGTNNKIFGLQCADGLGNMATPVLRELYLDVSAPQTTILYNGNDTISYVSYDRSTSLGIGSGTKRIYYSIDGGEWAYVPYSQGTISTRILSAGRHTVLYYGMDNLDNNEMTFRENNPQYVAFEITRFGNNICGFTNLMILVLIAGILIAILITGLSIYNGNLDMSVIIATSILALTCLLIIVIISNIVPIICQI
jgi:hypothetical protein